MVPTDSYSEEHLAAVTSWRKVVWNIKRWMTLRLRPRLMKSTFALECFPVFLIQLHSGFLEAEAIAHHKA